MGESQAALAGPQAAFEEFLEQGRFMIQRSRSTGEYIFYPKVLAPSGATDLEWVEASGRGTVYAITVNRKREGAYNIALIDLEEGSRMMSTIRGHETLPIGTAVEARIDRNTTPPRIVFVPASAAGAAQ